MSLKPADPSRGAWPSAEALAFIERAPPPVHEPITLESIVRRRAEGRATYAPASERAIALHKVRVGESIVAGITRQEVLAPGQGDGAPARTILYFFGGGYAVGSPFEDMPIIAALAAGTGARVVAPAYRLAPEHRYPAAIEDGCKVYRSLIETIDPSTLALAGESAGGNLALAVLGHARKVGLPMPRAAALLSPWSDLSRAACERDAVTPGDPTLDHLSLETFAAAYAGETDRNDPGLSPLLGPFDAAWPPTIITTGTRDALLRQCTRLSRLMREASVVVDLHVWDGLWHVFEFYDEVPEAARSLHEIAAFLDRHFGATPPVRAGLAKA